VGRDSALLAAPGAEDVAVRTFLAHRAFYHPIAANQLAKDLGIPADAVPS
jgi:hypothetical protein